MTRPVHTVRAEDSIEQAAALLSGQNITAAPVLDKAGDLIGIVSEGDVLRARTGHRPEGSLPVYVADVMTRKPVVMPLDADLSAVAAAMLSNNVHSVPIVDDGGGVAGILCRHDVLRAYVRSDDLIQVDVQKRLDQYAGGDRTWTVTVRSGVAEITGDYVDDTERNVVEVLARTVPGVSQVRRHR